MKEFLILMILGLSPLAYSDSEAPYKDMPEGLEAQLFAEAKVEDTAETKKDKTLNRTAERINEDTDKCEDKNKWCYNQEKWHDCYDYCDDLYYTRENKRHCERMTVTEVEALWNLYQLLDDPDSEELSKIDVEDFKFYLHKTGKGSRGAGVWSSSLDHLIKDYSVWEAKEFLIWLIENEEIAKLFKSYDNDWGADHDYNTLDLLFKRFKGNYKSNNEIDESFVTGLEISLLLRKTAKSDFVLEWFQDYINEKNEALYE